MNDLEIDVGQVEEFQMTRNLHELDIIFQRAYSTITGGRKVILFRRLSTGKKEKFDEIVTEPDLNYYKKQVYKYL